MINKFKEFLAKLRMKFGSKKPQVQKEFEDQNLSENTSQIPLPPTELTSIVDISDMPEVEKMTSTNIKITRQKKLKDIAISSLNKFVQLIQIIWAKITKNKNFKSGAANAIKFSQLLDNLLSAQYRSYIHRFSLIAFSFLFAYSVGKVTAIILRGKPEFESTKTTEREEFKPAFDVNSLAQVRSSNPFKTNVAGEKPKLADTKCDKAQQKSTLPIKLMNSVVLQDEVKSIASVQVRTDRLLKEVRVGDQIDQLAKVFKIQRLSLIVRNLETGVCESVDSDALKQIGPKINVMSPADSKTFKAQKKKMQGIDNQGNNFTISKKLLSEKMKDIGTILTQAEAIKLQNPDGTIAFKMTNIEPGSIYTFLGMENDDVITSINGRPITDINDIMNMFGKIESVSKLQLGIKRSGEDTQLDYTMK
jgi:type II secretory pathway component PulC